MGPIHIQPVTRDNWEQAVQLSIEDRQIPFVPSVLEGIAYAYIKPWDEALDPYVLESEGRIIGFFYLSYTPGSVDNYWIGGFQIDKSFQGMGIGRRALKAIIKFIKQQHSLCQVISLTVDRRNLAAQNLYQSMLFVDENKTNQDDEVIYRLNIR